MLHKNNAGGVITMNHCVDLLECHLNCVNCLELKRKDYRMWHWTHYVHDWTQQRL